MNYIFYLPGVCAAIFAGLAVFDADIVQTSVQLKTMGLVAVSAASLYLLNFCG